MPPAIFVFVLGACVGSFLNVVIYRLPNNMRLLVPASSCPSCNHKLRFFRENVPIIGWLAIRGKCRYCKAPVSMEYPIVELVTALLFLACYSMCYWIPESTPFLGEIFGPWWHDNGVIKTLPMFLSLLTLVAGLLAMTIIDARTFTIPIQIPLFMTAVGFLAALLQPHLNMRHLPEQVWPYPLVDWTWAGAAFGGMIGVC
ncbi:MAG: prepilin peptidase, partial [Phycisphaerae bacterium]|nr:prepilin peptidase [Phycisphaerae bacterium]